MTAAEMSIPSLTLDEFQRQYPHSGGGGTDHKTVLIIEDGIYDVTDFAASHPGGYNIIHRQHGTDATVNFNAVGHSQDARRLMQSFLIGRIVQAAAASTRTEAEDESTTVMIYDETDALVSSDAAQGTTEVAAAESADAPQQPNLFNGMFSGTQSPGYSPPGGMPGTRSLDIVEEVLHQRDHLNDDAAGMTVKLRRAIDHNAHHPHEERIRGYDPPLVADDEATADERKRTEAQEHQETMRQCYGNWWHTERRKSILATHPEIRKLVEEQHSFVFTIVLGFFAAALHFCVVWNWIPNLLKSASRKRVEATFEYGLLSNPLTTLFVDGPFYFFPETPIYGLSGFGTFMVVLPIVFILAYTVGAWCKMTSFAVGHEIAHEAIHPWISVLGTPQDERGVRFAVRVLLKDLCLRIASLLKVFLALSCLC